MCPEESETKRRQRNCIYFLAATIARSPQTCIQIFFFLPFSIYSWCRLHELWHWIENQMFHAMVTTEAKQRKTNSPNCKRKKKGKEFSLLNICVGCWPQWKLKCTNAKLKLKKKMIFWIQPWRINLFHGEFLQFFFCSVFFHVDGLMLSVMLIQTFDGWKQFSLKKRKFIASQNFRIIFFYDVILSRSFWWKATVKIVGKFFFSFSNK